MALLRKEFTRAQHRSHTRLDANSFRVQCFGMASAALTKDRVLHLMFFKTKKKFRRLERNLENLEIY